MSEPDARALERGYHETDAVYNLPNDSTEHARLDDQAAGLSELMHNTIIHAPLHHPSTILDIGCGTGTVTCHLGTLFPTAHVYGIDLSPVPAHVSPPPNVSFIRGDIRTSAGHDPRLQLSSLDFVFSRLLICGVTDWPGYVHDAAALLKPGGWAEMQDLDYRWFRDGAECSTEWEWMRALEAGAQRKGLDVHCGPKIAGYMHAAGLVEVQTREYRIPFGGWAAGERPETRRIGEHSARENGMLYHHLIARMLEGMGYGEERIAEFQRESKRDLAAEAGKDWVFYVTVGKKPEG